MDKAQRLKIAEGFKAAKKQLAHDYIDRAKQKMICFALNQACGYGAMDEATMYACKDVIEERLNGHSTYGEWVVYEGGIEHRALTADHTNNSGRQRQAGRHAWVDSLIAEFSA